MKHPIAAARARSRERSGLTIPELSKEHATRDVERLIKRGMVPGALITEGTHTVLLFAVNVRGHAGLPPGLFTRTPPILIKEASLVLMCGAGSTSRLATIMTAGLLTGFWRLVRRDSSA